jgi:hypothetical protein
MNFDGLEPIMANFQKCQSVISEKMKNVEHQFLSSRMIKHFAEQNEKIAVLSERINQRNNKLASYFRNRTSHPDLERILSKMENVFGIQNRD